MIFASGLQIGLALAVLLSLVFSGLNVQPAAAAIPSGSSEYFIPGFSDDLMHALEDIAMPNDGTSPYNNTAGDQLTNIITVSVGGDATLYYDHWENGYSSGAAGDRTFTVHKGDVLTFRSTTISEPRGTSLTCSGGVYIVNGSSTTTNECYDGRDRIYVVGSAISVAQAFWPTTLNTNFANAWEIYPVKPYQTEYAIPIGEDMYGPTYYDTFTTAAYNNSDGSAVWTGDSWVESGADAGGSPTAGTTRIVGGKLHFDGTAAASNIDRRVNLNGATGVILSFDYTITDTIEAGDTLAVQASNGGAYTTLVTLTGGNGNFTNPGSGSYTVNLANYNNTNSRIRFVVTGFTDGTEALDIDNVRVHYTTTGSTDGRRDFQEAYVFAMAYEDGTTVQIDDPETAGVEVNVNLNKGQTIYLDHIFAGTKVTATKPVQVQFLIGQAVQNYNSRSYTAVPSGLWSSEYYSPMPGGMVGRNTDLYVFNPTASPLVIEWADTSGSGTFTIPADSTVSYRDATTPQHYVPLNSAVHLRAQDGNTKFWAIGGADVSSSTFNWGFTLIPPQELTEEYYVSWAPGGWNQGPATPQQSDYSPIYATPVEDNTIIFVDYSPTDGIVDATYTLDRLQVQRIFDQTAAGHTRDADNTGTHIWASAPIALVWGQDTTGISPTASPGLDAGYTILPFNQNWLDVVLLMDKTANPELIEDKAGQTSVFTLTVRTDTAAVNGVNVTDTLPANWAFVNNSADIALPNGTHITGAAANPGIAGQLLTWNLGLNMAAGETLVITFTGITTAAPHAASVNSAEATGTSGGNTYTAEDTAVVNASNLGVTKTSDAGGTVYPGQVITYTITVTNSGSARQNHIVVKDPLPAGTTYNAQSTVASGYLGGSYTYLDTFSTTAFNNSNATAAWSSSWVETGDNGVAGTGKIQINAATAGVARFDATAQADVLSLTRPANLSGVTSATLTYDLVESGNNNNAGDYVEIQVSPDGGSSWTTLYTANQDFTSYSGNHDITAHANANTRIRFVVHGYEGNSSNLNLDNVQIAFTPTISAITKDNIPGGANLDLTSGLPSTLVNATDNFTLDPGQSMTVTFWVTARDVIQREIKNTATVSSDESSPVHATVIDNFYPTPVTLSYFTSLRQDNTVSFDWSTSTESGNVGFNLYGVVDGQRVQLNADLIPSAVSDSLERQDYTYSAWTDASEFYVEDVSISGATRRHGPFALGEESGTRLEADKVDWAEVAAQSSQQEELAADAADPGLLPLKVGKSGAQAVQLKVQKSGLYRVSYEQLLAAGLDWKDVPSAKLTLTMNGKAQPIFVSRAVFGAGAYLEFYGRGLDTLYTDTNVYTLKVEAGKWPRIAAKAVAIPAKVKAAGSYLETLTVNEQKAYANYAPGADAWYDTRLLAFASKPVTKEVAFTVENLVANTPATLSLTVWGVTDWPSGADHHLQVWVNGASVADVRFDGFVENVVKVTLPAGVLREGENSLTLTAPGDTGEQWDVMNFDKFSLTYVRKLIARGGQLTFTSSEPVFRVTNLPNKNVVVYQLVNNRPVRLSKVQVKQNGKTYMVTFANPGKGAGVFIVSTVKALNAPALAAMPKIGNLEQPAEYLIITHPDFISGIEPLAQVRRGQFRSVSVVNVEDLYAKYTYGVFDPQAIRQYIAYASKNLGTKYVLLVGGDTYDYRNYLGVNSLSFIPSLYAQTSTVVRFAPVDPLYADVDGDKIPDLAIGRFPVRTVAELERLVGKTLAYGQGGKTILFAADVKDGPLNFKQANLEMSASLGDWNVVSVDLDEMDKATARAGLLNGMNAGTSLITFSGHSSMDRWTYQGLFTLADAKALTNAGKPFVAVQWGCWNNYYVDPVNNGLVQELLVNGDRGAAATLGASSLTDGFSERQLGLLLTPRLTTPGTTIGAALRDAKLEFAQMHLGWLDILLGWSLMGDPALVIVP